MRFTKLFQWVRAILLWAFLFSPPFIWGANTNRLHSFSQNNWKCVPGELIVKLKRAPSDVQVTQSLVSAFAPFLVVDAKPLFPKSAKEKLRKASPDDLNKIYKMRVGKEADIRLLCQKLLASGQVEYAEPNYLLPVEAVPDDSLYSELWHLKQIQADKAWDIAKGSSSVIIAIVDTGVDWDHPDLAASIWKNGSESLDGIDNDGNGYIDDVRGWDFVDGVADAAAGEDGIKEDNNPMDFDGHGTFVSGLAGATTNNRIGVSSVSWGCQIMPLRVGYRSVGGGGYIILDLAARAFKYAADNGARVINLSTASANVLVDAGRYAFTKGVVICKSAGNMNSSEPDPLELEPYVISVAAVDDIDRKASYSDYGDWVKISAPGGDLSRSRPGLTSTYYNNRYSVQHGTSFASPIVAGMAGLLLSAQPSLSAADVLFRLTGTADNIDSSNPSYIGKLGSGRVNAYRALTEEVQSEPQISFMGLRIDDASNGNGNGVLDPGERASLIVTLQNNWGDANNVNASLSVDYWAVGIIEAQSAFGAIPGLSNFPNNVGENVSDPFVISVSESALPQIVPAKLDITDGDGGHWTSEIKIPISPSILIVDDDDGENNVESYYTAVLDSLGFTYKIWDHQLQGSPTDVLQNFSTVIWLCEWTFPSLDSLDRAIIADYLDHGGRLFLSGQDIGWDLCEDPGNDQSNEFTNSGGASKQFYRQYLRAQYVADASQYSHLAGAANDPISDGLEIDVFQPGRATDYQFPSEIEPLNGSVAVFVYPNNRKGAVRYAGDYRLVYFAFGGFEAITSAVTRRNIMPKILNWLNDFSFEHESLHDTENTETAYPVAVKAKSGAWPIANIKLVWNIDGALPYHSVEMAKQSDDSYYADIPAQSGGRMAYTFYIRLTNGYVAPIHFYRFKIGPDLEAPNMMTVLAPLATLKKRDIQLVVQAIDEAGIDPSSVYLHYSSTKKPADSLLMVNESGSNEFSSTMPGPFGYGDSIIYYFAARDLAKAKNRAVTETDTLVIGLDDFENGIDGWIPEPADSWGQDGTQKHSGEFSVNDSPYAELVPAQTATFTLSNALDFSQSTAAEISFWSKYYLRAQMDFGMVEISADSGTTWEGIGEQITGFNTDWHQISVDLTDYLAQGKKHLTLRFKIVTSPEVNLAMTGWFIDDFQVTENLQVGVQPENENAAALPMQFALGPNYPNPFNPNTHITFAIAELVPVRLEVFNSLGQHLRTLVDEKLIAGLYERVWDAKDDQDHAMSAGIYFVRLQAGEFHAVRKIALVR